MPECVHACKFVFFLCLGSFHRSLLFCISASQNCSYLVFAGHHRKVVFLARTVPLVSQQHRNFKAYLSEYEVSNSVSKLSCQQHHFSSVGVTPPLQIVAQSQHKVKQPVCTEFNPFTTKFASTVPMTQLAVRQLCTAVVVVAFPSWGSPGTCNCTLTNAFHRLRALHVGHFV